MAELAYAAGLKLAGFTTLWVQVPLLLLSKFMKDEFIIKANSMITFSDSRSIYWADLDGNWTKTRQYARRLPEDIAKTLTKYLSWEGVQVTIEKY